MAEGPIAQTCSSRASGLGLTIDLAAKSGAQMRDFFFATDGSAAAWATARQCELGFNGRVRF